MAQEDARKILINQILEVKRKDPLNFSKIRQLQQALDNLPSR